MGRLPATLRTGSGPELCVLIDLNRAGHSTQCQDFCAIRTKDSFILYIDGLGNGGVSGAFPVRGGASRQREHGKGSDPQACSNYGGHYRHPCNVSQPDFNRYLVKIASNRKDPVPDSDQAWLGQGQPIHPFMAIVAESPHPGERRGNAWL